MSRPYSILMITAILTIFTGCASLKVNHDYDPGVNFDALKTYDWIPMEENTGASSQLIVKRIVHTVNTTLSAKGLKLNPDHPDFLIGMQISGKSSYGGSTGLGASVGIPVRKWTDVYALLTRDNLCKEKGHVEQDHAVIQDWHHRFLRHIHPGALL